ncbi:hypothetical protein TWF694_009260 [Orbilia ellipsospora]|uniref:Uncharacterized protein n=1 Tax=Orbilia ellipsospora TaxID=2528407 RepID=A0AAV9XEU9_9PEZI
MRATQFSTRVSQAKSDCNSIWVTTVTPPTFTVTSTSTISVITISTSHVAQTNTIHRTTTVLETQTSTVQVGVTSTKTVIAPSAKPLKHKRIVTDIVTSASLPAYASPCSNMSRFTSACVCIGVTTQFTVTAPSPSVTKTVSQTTTISQTISVTDTSFLTTTDVTTTQTFTTTTTVGSIATVSASKFKLSATVNGVVKYFSIVLAGTNLYYLQTNIATTADAAATFYIDPSGLLYSLDNGFQEAIGNAAGNINGGSFVRLINAITSANDAAISCAISDALVVTCSSPPGYNKFLVDTVKLTLYLNFPSSSTSSTAITLYAIPVF